MKRQLLLRNFFRKTLIFRFQIVKRVRIANKLLFILFEKDDGKAEREEASTEEFAR